MVEAMGPDQRTFRREAIEHLKQRWQEFYRSPSGQPTEINPGKELSLLLEGTDYTRAFRQLTCDYALDHGSPDEALASMFINLETDDLGILEPGVEADIERNSLAQALILATMSFKIEDGATILSFPPMHKMHSPALIPLIEWADEFREKRQDDSFTVEVEQLRPYLPAPAKLN